MSAIRLVSALTFLLGASTSAYAGSPAASIDAPRLAGVESGLLNLELNLTEVDAAVADDQAGLAQQSGRGAGRAATRSPTLAQYLNAPAPYGQLLPEPIDDRGVGYRLWF